MGIKNIDCFTGDGFDYRGTKSTPIGYFDARCTKWYKKYSTDWVSLGHHNHCRNPDGESRPWCYINTIFFWVRWTFCDIRKCNACDKGKKITQNHH